MKGLSQAGIFLQVVINAIKRKGRKRCLEHWGLYYAIADGINIHHCFGRVSFPSPIIVFKPMVSFVSCSVSSRL